MAPIVGVVFAVVVVIAVMAYTLHNDRRASNGFWLWQRVAMKRRGLRARGIVLSRIDRGVVVSGKHRSVHRFDYVVEVHLEGEQPYRVPMIWWTSLLDYTTSEGKDIPVLVDPHDRKRVLYDESALHEEYEAERRRKELAGEEKQRKLLAGDDPS